MAWCIDILLCKFYITLLILFCFYDICNSTDILNLIAGKYKMTISSTKTKAMAMCGNYIQRVKIVINNNIIEQVTGFIILGVPYIRIQK